MLALQLLEAEDFDGIVKEFTNTKNPKDSVTVIEFVITLLRSLFQATQGKKFIVADLNAIENRILGWAAGCKSILDVFRTCNDCGHVAEELTGSFLCPKCGCSSARCPYLSFGTQLFNKDYAQMWKEYKAELNDDRQNSKPAVLGGGYGLGGGEMQKNEYGDMVRGGLWGYALNVCQVDMPKELAHKAVDIFRKSYPEVVQFWTDLEEAFKQVLAAGGVIKVGEVSWDKKIREWVKHPSPLGCVLTFTRIKMADGGYTIRMQLPSGRALHYLNATIDAEEKVSKRTGRKYTAYQLHYDGIEHSATQNADGSKAKQRHKWGRVKTYGGKICENAIQAIARDILLNGMLLADEMGIPLWGLFHDELAAEVSIEDFGGFRLADLIYCMAEVPEWASGLLLGAEGFEGLVYRKG
jgi:DNA polymerase bacteriophage-type